MKSCLCVERTPTFLEFVSKSKKTEKDVSSILSHENLASKDGKSSLSNPKHSKDEATFSQNAKILVQSITKLKDFLERHQAEYLSPSVSVSGRLGSGSGPGSGSSLSDVDRDRIDEEAEALIKLSSASLANLQRKLTADTSPQKGEHEKMVLVLIEAYLKSVCEVYSHQRAIRVKSNVERARLSKLQSVCKNTRSSAYGAAVAEDLSKSRSVSSDVSANLNADEIQQLELENEQLLNELTGMNDQVEAIEGQVVEISRLQSIFTEHVLKQSDQIDNVHTTAVSSTENVKEGNEHIRAAIQNNAGLRFWILFFLIVLSFTLLFLDWYDT